MMAANLYDCYLTVEQTRMLDRLAVQRFRMPSIVLMENAARSAMAAIVTTYPPDEFARLSFLVGAGNNGGDALAVARLAHNEGYDVRLLWAVEPVSLKGDAAVNRDIAAAMGLEADRLRDGETIDLERARSALETSDLAIDGLLGTGLSGPVRPPLRDLIELVNEQASLPVVALDVPSGFDADEGLPAGAGEGSAIIAALTVTFGANKVGYSQPGSATYTGPVLVGTIGAPIELLDEVRRLAD